MSIAAHQPKLPRHNIYLRKRADIQGIHNDGQFCRGLQTTTCDSVQYVWQTFKEHIHQTIEKQVPSNLTLVRHTHPWMNGSIRRLIRWKQRAHEKSRQTGLKRDHDRYKQLQQDVQYQIRSAHKTYMKEAVSNSLKDNIKKFWSIIKDKVQEATRVSPLKNMDGFIKSDSQSKANVLNDRFVSALKKEDIPFSQTES